MSSQREGASLLSALGLPVRPRGRTDLAVLLPGEAPTLLEEAIDLPFEQGSLGRSPLFRQAMGELPESAAVRAYVAGSLLYAVLRDELRRFRLPASLAALLPLPGTVAAAALPDQGGFRLVGRASLPARDQPPRIEPRLPAEVLAGASLLLVTSRLDRPLGALLAGLDRLSPGLDQKLRLAQAALGLSLEGDILPALSGEAALARYREGEGLVVRLDRQGERVVHQLLARLGPILALAKLGSLRALSPGAYRLSLPGPKLALLVALEPGKLLLATSAATLSRMRAHAAPLARQPTYRALLARARLPSQVSALLYVSLPRVAALVGLRPEGGGLGIEGFLSVE
ncbi:MAG: hypothetical protein C4306_08210 [Thermoleophilia bacterium]